MDICTSCKGSRRPGGANSGSGLTEFPGRDGWWTRACRIIEQHHSRRGRRSPESAIARLSRPARREPRRARVRCRCAPVCIEPGYQAARADIQCCEFPAEYADQGHRRHLVDHRAADQEREGHTEWNAGFDEADEKWHRRTGSKWCHGVERHGESCPVRGTTRRPPAAASAPPPVRCPRRGSDPVAR